MPALPSEPGDLYNVTKLAGEALCLSDPRPTVRVARLSNVYGIGMREETFLGQVLREGQATGNVVLRKPAAPRRTMSASQRWCRLPAGHRRPAAPRGLYNVASGATPATTPLPASARIAGWHIGLTPNAPAVRFPPIDTARLDTEFWPTAAIWCLEICRPC